MTPITEAIHFAQIAIATTSTPAWTAIVTSAAAVVVVSLQGWLVRVGLQNRDDMRGLRQYWFGLDGDNGMNSKVKSLSRRIERHDEQFAAHDKRISHVEYMLDKGEGAE